MIGGGEEGEVGGRERQAKRAKGKTFGFLFSFPPLSRQVSRFALTSEFSRDFVRTFNDQISIERDTHIEWSGIH